MWRAAKDRGWWGAVVWGSWLPLAWLVGGVDLWVGGWWEKILLGWRGAGWRRNPRRGRGISVGWTDREMGEWR